MKKVWNEWMGKGNLQILGIAGVGHFIAEESPEPGPELLEETTYKGAFAR